MRKGWLLLFAVVSVTVPSAPGLIHGLGKSGDQGEIVIDRLIEILKDAAAQREQRTSACVALAKRGAKAKRAVPEMVKFLQEMWEKDLDKNAGADAYLSGTENRLIKVMDGLANFGTDAKEALPVLAKIVNSRIFEATGAVSTFKTNHAAAEALGKIGSAEAFAGLLKACASKQYADIRKAGIKGLAYFAHGNDADLKVKARAELEVMAETDLDAMVRMLAKEMLQPPQDKNTLTVAADNVGLKPSNGDVVEATMKVVRGDGDKVKGKDVNVVLTNADKLKDRGLRLDVDQLTIKGDGDVGVFKIRVDDAARFKENVEIHFTATVKDGPKASGQLTVKCLK